MNIQSLLAAICIDYDLATDYDGRLIYLWGEFGFDSWGAQLIHVNGKATVIFKPGSGAILHEACHAIFGMEDETSIFAYEWLVASELTGEDRIAWEKFFSVCVVDNAGSEGSHVLQGRDISEDWESAFTWLEANGFTFKGSPVYGLGQSCSLPNNARHEKEIASEYIKQTLIKFPRRMENGISS